MLFRHAAITPTDSSVIEWSVTYGVPFHLWPFQMRGQRGSFSFETETLRAWHRDCESIGRYSSTSHVAEPGTERVSAIYPVCLLLQIFFITTFRFTKSDKARPNETDDRQIRPTNPGWLLEKFAPDKHDHGICIQFCRRHNVGSGMK